MSEKKSGLVQNLKSPPPIKQKVLYLRTFFKFRAITLKIT